MRRMLSLMRACVDEYHMIEPGDTVAVGVSGGKDSLTLLAVLASLRGFYPKPFTLIAITLDMGYPEMDFSAVAALCEKLGVPYHIRETQIKQVVFDERREKNPCSLCAKMRRGALNNAALSLGANKVALGHHWDDAVETFMLSLIYEGRISCFQPVTLLDRSGVTQIRPLLYARERAIRNFAARQALPIVHNPCPVDKHTKREDVKALLYELEGRYPGLKEHIFGGLQRSPLPGWRAERDD
jgi:tRNA(Ile)-lysidine synthase TilS/MesJ